MTIKITVGFCTQCAHGRIVVYQDHDEDATHVVLGIHLHLGKVE